MPVGVRTCVLCPVSVLSMVCVERSSCCVVVSVYYARVNESCEHVHVCVKGVCVQFVNICSCVLAMHAGDQNVTTHTNAQARARISMYTRVHACAYANA